MPLIESNHSPYANAVTVLIFALLVIGAGVFFLIMPQYQARSSNVELLEQKKSKTSELDATVAKAKQSIENLNSNLDVINRMDLAVPGKLSRTEIYAHFETLTEASNMNIKSINVPDPEPAAASGPDSAGRGPAQAGAPSVVTTIPSLPGVKVLPIQLTVTGNYNSLSQLLTTLGQSLFFIDVQRIDVTKDSSTPDSFQFQINMNSYYYQK